MCVNTAAKRVSNDVSISTGDTRTMNPQDRFIPETLPILSFQFVFFMVFFLIVICPPEGAALSGQQRILGQTEELWPQDHSGSRDSTVQRTFIHVEMQVNTQASRGQCGACMLVYSVP